MIVINTSSNRVENRRLEEISKPIRLTKKETRLLKALAGNEIVPVEDLTHFVLGQRLNKRSHATIRNIVNRTRKKGFEIKSFYSKGYQLVTEVAIE